MTITCWGTAFHSIDRVPGMFVMCFHTSINSFNPQNEPMRWALILPRLYRTLRHREAKSPAWGHPAGGRGASSPGVGALHHHTPLPHPPLSLTQGWHTPCSINTSLTGRQFLSSLFGFMFQTASLLPTIEFPIWDLRSVASSVSG